MPPSHRLDRFERLDALRGLAMFWMAAFHFCFDLNFYRLLSPPQNFYQDPFWTLQRTAIVSLFLLCAGLSQALAHEAGQGGRRFWKRWVQIAGCALLVSAGSWFMFPRSWISFGVLHGMALMLILARVLAPLGRGLWPLALVALLLPHGVQHPVFDSRWLNWTGLVTRKPITEDFVPVLPWLGVMLLGLAAGQWLLAHRRAVLGGALPRVLAPLATLGRWPLSFYMLHQPVLIGLILLAKQLG
ncbi:DUF1624 domain-containing protein [Azohydromonas australica]|uniref:DUF1624 domain-containing protein n=1 Tax=Azohydromonas australica TaxID=364039 RepID=UPI0004057E13|nr:heparan-alpha-glucosaminide N-acetyltransferase [Azohydromonas australica]